MRHIARNQYNILKLVAAAFLSSISSSAFALVGIESDSNPLLLNQPTHNRLKLPKPRSGLPQLLQIDDPITRSLRKSITESAFGALKRRGMLPAGFQLVEDPSSNPSALQLSSGLSAAQSLKFTLGGIEACSGDLRVVRLRDGSVQIMTSATLAADLDPPQSDSFPTSEDIEPMLATYASEHDHELGATKLLGRCWYFNNQRVEAAVRLRVHLNRLPYQVIATEENLVNVEPLFFSAIGKSRIYKNNPTDPATVSFSLGELTGTGKLESSAFTTQVNGAKPAQSCDHNFSFEPSDERFAEASAFTNTTRTLSWFKSKLGYEWRDDPMTIRIHEEIGSPPNEKNNALYQPPSATEDGRPNILIGDGDGIQLQNLAFDQDVVSHEFGHHIVYRTLKSTQRESLVLHEGLADFFTFARTDNACLGESICPDGSQICWSESCLRTAENSLKFTDASLPTQAHLRSQFISGMLWDLKITKSIPIEDVAKIVFKSVDFFASEMVYEQFIASLISADREIFDGKNCEAILAVATDRGLGARLSDVKCTASSLNLAAKAGGQNMAMTDESATDTDEKYILKISDNIEDALPTTSLCAAPVKSSGALLTPCGVIGHDGSGPNQAGLILLAPAIAVAALYLRGRRIRRRHSWSSSIGS